MANSGSIASFPSPLITRFAPSPTGLLHLGHVANAVYVWGLARRHAGTICLRLEDHDRGRFRPAYEDAILRDLEWLGLEPDINSIQSFRDGSSAFRQSDRFAVYEKYAADLERKQLAYACECTRADIAGAGRVSAGEEAVYPGRCRERGLAVGPGLGLRVKLPDRIVRFHDLSLGPQAQNPQHQCGDLLIRDRTGNWTYQFCVAVDDLEQQISLVIRGRDLLSSTGRQLALRGLLGTHEPLDFFHHELINDTDGRKLSKRDGALGLASLRASGISPQEVLGRAVFLMGLTDVERAMDGEALGELFV